MPVDLKNKRCLKQTEPSPEENPEGTASRMN